MSITLNSFVAFFTTFAKAAFMIPLAETMSQWKWNWFREDRPLSDFQVFDDASRGVLGSLVLLRRLSYRHIASIGAAVYVLGILTSPITQLVISYPERLMPVEGGRAVALASQTLQENRLNPLALSYLQNAIFNGLISPFDVKINPLSPQCSSAECTFPSFQSLGLCTKTVNITHLLNVTSSGSSQEASITNQTAASTVRPGFLAMLPPKANCRLESSSTYAVATCKTNGTDSLSYETDENLRKSAVYVMPIIYANAGNSASDAANGPGKGAWQFQAMEVMFHLCVNTYDAKVTQGSDTTSTTESSAVIASGAVSSTVDVNCTNPASVPAGTAGCTANRFLPPTAILQLQNPAKRESTNPGDYYKADVKTLQNLAVALHTATSGLFEWDGGDDRAPLIVGVGGGGGTGLQTIANAIFGPRDNDTARQVGRVSNTMENLAVSVTNAYVLMLRTSLLI
jgi:hypothetical protein